ncbi:MAG: hypothetical protein VB853_00010 [Pirellulales bacterium]
MSFLKRQLEDSVRLPRIKRCCYAILAVIVLAEIVLPHLFHGGHSHFDVERFPAWGSLFGLISCVAIIVVSKFLGKLWLMRREDYYDA